MTVKFEIWGTKQEMSVEDFCKFATDLRKAVENEGKDWNEFVKEAGIKAI